VLAGLVFLQDDLGTALVYMTIALAMMFAAGLSVWYYVIGGTAAVVAFPYIWPLLGEYQRMRILVGFNPELDPTDFGMQALMSRRAITAGGIFGTGLNGGGYYENVPMANNDFVLSMIGEKFGFVGCAAVVLLFAVLIIRIFIIAIRARKDCGAYIAVGCGALLLAQVTENLGMALAMLPVVGITLPFISYGGSSVLSLYMMVGIMQSICTHAKKYHFEREEA
jgi:rod shape determining protein RodA